MDSSIKGDKVFTPHQDLKKLYYAYLTLGSIVFYLSWAVPTTLIISSNSPLTTTVIASFSIFIPFLVIVSLTIFWIPKFYSSLSYLLTDSDIITEKGVWWKHKGIVPYNRVTNIDVVQGPLSRQFRLGKVSIQTAGFSAGGSSGSTKVAEAVIVGIKNFEEVKDFVIGKVKRLRPMAVEAEPEFTDIADNVNIQILEELKKIRESLNERKKS